MTTKGHVFFWLTIVSAVVIPFIAIDALKAVKNEKDTLLHKIALAVCGGIIMWTVLMMIRPY